MGAKEDCEGFLYPEVDLDKCVDCGLCDKVCAFNNKYDKSLNLPSPVSFSARHKNFDEVLKSTSGAVFAAASDYVISKGGVIYGAGFDGFRARNRDLIQTHRQARCVLLF